MHMLLALVVSWNIRRESNHKGVYFTGRVSGLQWPVFSYTKKIGQEHVMRPWPEYS